MTGPKPAAGATHVASALVTVGGVTVVDLCVSPGLHVVPICCIVVVEVAVSFCEVQEAAFMVVHSKLEALAHACLCLGKGRVGGLRGVEEGGGGGGAQRLTDGSAVSVPENGAHV